MSIGIRQTFTRKERLSKTKLIREIFEKGNVFYTDLFRVLWIKTGEAEPLSQIAVSVPKKVFRHAVTRNLIKRRMREAFRRHKNNLYEYLNERNIHIAFIVIYKNDVIPGYHTVENSVVDLIKRLCDRLEKKK